MANIKILCCYHKEEPLLKSEIIIPVHAGRAVASEENSRALAGIIGDNTGDNISELNPYFNELTVIYWAWKNRAALGGPEYIGLSHYRRQFTLKKHGNLKSFDPRGTYYKLFERDFIKDPSRMKRFIQKYDIVVPESHVKPCRSNAHGARADYLRAFNNQALEEALSIFKNRNPQDAQLIEQLADSPCFHPFNMSVMRWPLFDAYCHFLFDSLLEFAKKFPPQDPHSPFPPRTCGMVGERMTSIWVELMRQTHPELRIGTLEVARRDDISSAPKTLKEIDARYIWRHPLFLFKPQFWKAVFRSF